MIKIFLFINLIIIFPAKIRLSEFSQDCLIYNQKYSNEYLFASNNIFTAGIINVQNPNHNVYSIPKESVDDFNKLKWTLEQVNRPNSTLVTLKSNKGEYLCASNLYHDLFRHRRRIYLKGKNNKNRSMSIIRNCEWRLEQFAEKKIQTFIIWNDFYNEPLYAPSFFYKYNSIKRYIYSWKRSRHRVPNSTGLSIVVKEVFIHRIKKSSISNLKKN